jgi:hypothetical protein
MKNSVRNFVALAALASLSSLTSSASAGWREFLGLAPVSVDRPPQFVLLAFDGSLNNSFWEESLNFAKQNEIDYTYFASGVYFLLNQNKALYTEPTHGAGKSAIGWGGTSATNLTNRMGYLRRAFAEGNEIGSHGNGHFDGSAWSYDEWKLEFSQFPKLIFEAFANNGIVPPKDFDLGFGISEVKGFRAPQLGQNPALYQVLADEGFHYDTSKVGTMNYWPEKRNGVWNYPLAAVRIAGTAKKTISMDYNFYIAQSRALPEKDPALQELYRKQMLQTYYDYFLNNYNGNRAPVHIGHHFSKWNGGAYWKAMKEFARTACKLPEVRCVTYGALTDWLSAKSPEELAAYSRGSFPRSEPISIPPVLANPNPLAAAATISDPNAERISVELSGADAETLAARPDLEVEWTLDGALIGSGLEIPSAPIRAKARAMSTLSVALRADHVEVLRTTRKITTNGFRSLVIDGVDFESRALKGDLPEAHSDESNRLPKAPRLGDDLS